METKLAENIRAYRKQRNLTQEQLAEVLGVTVGAVHKWENRLSTPELAMIMDEAHRRKVPVTAHAIGEMGIRACLKAGIDCIEHGQYIQEDMAAFMAEGSVFR